MPAGVMAAPRLRLGLRLGLCLAALAACPACGLRLGGAGAGAGADADPLQFFRQVDVRDIGFADSNTSEEVSAFIRELGTARVSQEFRPSLQLVGGGWRLAIPMSQNNSEDVGTVGCPELPDDGGNVHMLVTQRGDLCMAGSGFQTRAASTMAMVQEAAGVLRRRGQPLAPCERRTICIRDNCPTSADYGYSCGGDCTPIPDFTLWKWPEAGILPNFSVVSEHVEQIGASPASRNVCGWAGNPGTHSRVWGRFENATRNEYVYDIFLPRSPAGTEGRLSMEAQTRQWACMIDIPAQGYSGRVPMLLHSSRPLLMVERTRHSKGEVRYVDATFYAPWMQPYVHFIPVSANLSDLDAASDLALSPRGLEIGRNALNLARQNLTTQAAIEFLADALARPRPDKNASQHTRRHWRRANTSAEPHAMTGPRPGQNASQRGRRHSRSVNASAAPRVEPHGDATAGPKPDHQNASRRERRRWRRANASAEARPQKALEPFGHGGNPGKA